MNMLRNTNMYMPTKTMSQGGAWVVNLLDLVWKLHLWAVVVLLVVGMIDLGMR